MTDRDAFWAAKIIMRFTREELAAIVATGELSNPEAERYFLDALVERQHESARYYLNRVNPIDEFEVTPDGLSFVNLSARYGFAGPETDRAVAAALSVRSNPYAGTYRVRWSVYDNASDSTRPLGDTREQTETTVDEPDHRRGRTDHLADHCQHPHHPHHDAEHDAASQSAVDAVFEILRTHVKPPF